MDVISYPYWSSEVQNEIAYSTAFANVEYRSGLLLGLHPANERFRYKVPSLIGWVQT